MSEAVIIYKLTEAISVSDAGKAGSGVVSY